MSIMELGALGEFFAAIAVLVTLVYLAGQMRQAKVSQALSANAAKADMLHRTLSGFSRFRAFLADREMADIWRRGHANEALDPTEMTRFDVIASEYIYTVAIAYEAHVLLDHSRAADYVRMMNRLLSQGAVVSQLWDKRYVDELTDAGFDEFVKAVNTRR